MDAELHSKAEEIIKEKLKAYQEALDGTNLHQH